MTLNLHRTSKTSNKSFFGSIIALLLFPVVAYVVIVIVMLNQSADQKDVGACTSVQLGQGSNTEGAVLEALHKMGIDPDYVGGIHDAAVKGYNESAQSPGSYVSVCVTPDKDEVASVNGVNAGG